MPVSYTDPPYGPSLPRRYLGLGTIKEITAKLGMKPDARPNNRRTRPVPYVLQGAIEAEYNRMK